MSIFKCKMCGGTLEIGENQTTAVCEYCGTKQTLPKLDDEKRVYLYERANHFRRENEFDKAEAIYEQLLHEDRTDAEVYWSLVLCRFGIEYVEDPSTHKRMPTVNRAQFTSIFDDDNYKSALEHADAAQKVVYKKEAAEINEIQKGILAVSLKEEPFDVFICYKETDKNGRRTPDSVLATELYHQLINEGYKVFFSRITLEDKLGTAYEPYIFAALNSAKVMVVLGTKEEYLNAVWVKNEWSRYLTLAKESGGKKVLIPAYRDMDPYDLPEEFSHLQAQDMSKLGFMQDLIRGLGKIIGRRNSAPAVQETVAVNSISNSGNVSNDVTMNPLLERAFIFLEDGDFDRADDLCEQVLNREPKNGEAYLAKLMIDLKIETREDLANCELPFDDNKNCQKAIRFGDNSLKHELEHTNRYIHERNEHKRLDAIYDGAQLKMYSAQTVEEFQESANVFATIENYRDSAEKIRICQENITNIQNTKVYENAKVLQNEHGVESLEKAIDVYTGISGWRDVDEQIENCKREISEIKEREEAERKDGIYEAAEKHRLADTVAELKLAVDLYRQILGWKDADKKVDICNYRITAILQQIEIDRKDGIYEAAEKHCAASSIDELNLAVEQYKKIPGWKDSDAKAEVCLAKIATILHENEVAHKNDLYDNAEELRLKDNVFSLRQAIGVYGEISDWKDSDEKIEFCKQRIEELETQKEFERKNKLYESAEKYRETYNAAKLTKAISLYEKIVEYKDSAEKIELCKAQIEELQSIGLAGNGKKKGKIFAVVAAVLAVCCAVCGICYFTVLVPQQKYNEALAMVEEYKYEEAIALFTELGDYKDSVIQVQKCRDVLENEEKYVKAIKFANEQNYEEAIRLFKEIMFYRDGLDQLENCRQAMINIALTGKEEINIALTGKEEINIGEIVTFGNYEQDGNGGNGKEPIEWIVLDKKDECVLVLSKYILDSVQYHKELKKVTWETCTLRSWLKDVFLEEAFSDKEQIAIANTINENLDNVKYGTSGGNTTTDKVFLLNIEETNEYLKYSIDKIAYSTEYAKEILIHNTTKTGRASWWLRSSGATPKDAVRVSRSKNGIGEADSEGYCNEAVNKKGIGVRPAMWISTEYFEKQEKQEKYEEALSLIESEKYNEAIAILAGIIDYKDSVELIQKYQWKNCEIGNMVVFGRYEQDNNTENGKEPIEWLVLDKNDGKILVISKYALDCKEYNTNYVGVTWETCSLRSWLNRDFLNSAFSNTEKQIITTVRVSSDINPSYIMNFSNTTEDKVFVLSIAEANKYFAYDKVRRCKPTEYAKEQGAYVNSSNENCWWWLRTYGANLFQASFVHTDGRVSNSGDYIYVDDGAVRPALWISVEE